MQSFTIKFVLDEAKLRDFIKRAGFPADTPLQPLDDPERFFGDMIEGIEKTARLTAPFIEIEVVERGY